MIKIYSNTLLKILTLGQSFSAITLGVFVIFKNRSIATDRVVNHEHIHVKQQVELLFIGMWLLYALSYIFNRIKLLVGKELPVRTYWNTSHMKAYRNIIFEREAYGNDNNLDYIKNRKSFAWLAYINKTKRS